jgi:acetylxylan esterase
MKHRLVATGLLLAASIGFVMPSPAWAASLQSVPASNWSVSGLPSTASMYIYVPDKVASNPPILVLAHYCGGTASAVFGQASGIKMSADQYGFIMVVPQNANNCWDVGSTKSLTHDGGGDTHAIAQMVRYTITNYQANADRVYVTGDSSGGMMTQALLAVYPEIFKGGSSFAGVPAGCWADGYSASNQWSGNCAGGRTTFTAQQWGDKVRAMYPGYSGHRGRVQLFHGDGDTTISYKNQAEAIKEWTNVLGLDTNPTTTDSGLTLGSHQATRQRWKNACGYVVLEVWTSINGDHGPSDCLFNSNVVPFLGLDKTGATDPEIEQCGSGGTGGSPGTGGSTGAGGTGGSPGTGGGSGTGGRDGGPDGGGDAGTGGVVVTGGTLGRGGNSGTGGSVSSGGSSGDGGTQGSGGRQGSGGSTTSSGGGSSGSGGLQGTGGGQGTGGSIGSGGVAASGGSTGSGGNGSGGTSGTSETGGNSGSGATTTGGGSTANGCACALGAATSKKHGELEMGIFALGLALSALIRKRRNADSRAQGTQSRTLRWRS